jgi:hypothetical protein
LLLPGSGAVSSGRAGASVASAEDGEALSLNPSGMARGSGTRVQIGAAIINYYMTFARNGTYDDLPNDAQSYEGQAYPIVEQDAEPALGIGRYQPVPVIAVVSDLGGAVPNLTAAASRITRRTPTVAGSSPTSAIRRRRRATTSSSKRRRWCCRASASPIASSPSSTSARASPVASRT